MKKLLILILTIFVSNACAMAFEHPIDQYEEACKAATKDSIESEKCSMSAVLEWNKEVDKYYSLLNKKLLGENKTHLFESQKNWTIYKNHEFRLIDGLTDKAVGEDGKVIYKGDRKRDVMKTRATNLRLYYTWTFADPDKEMKTLEQKSALIPVNRNLSVSKFLYNIHSIFKGNI